MFKTAELGRSIPEDELKGRVADLRLKLLLAQHQLKSHAPFQVVVDLVGVDGAGKGSVVNALHAWLDTRLLITRSYTQKTDDERERPDYWRYWRDLPPRGRIGLYIRGRYNRPKMDFYEGRIDEAQFESEMDRIMAFEDELAADGALMLKFWLHLGRDAQERRLKELESSPATSWRVTDSDWGRWQRYDDYLGVAERAITQTNTGTAPWVIVESADPHYRDVTVAEALLEALAERLKDHGIDPFETKKHTKPPKKDPLPPRPEGPMTIVSALEQPDDVDKQEYEKRLLDLQAEHHVLQRDARRHGVSSMYVFEGPDAAGKGGAIRRLVATLDARNYQVLQFGAPTDEEAAQHYLWRFWRHMSRAGRLMVFDRSW